MLTGWALDLGINFAESGTMREARYWVEMAGLGECSLLIGLDLCEWQFLLQCHGIFQLANRDVLVHYYISIIGEHQ